MNENPQVENGYTAIANEIVEALSKSMQGGTEGQIIFAVLRKTYGWNKKEDKISISQLCKLTGKSKRAVIYALQNLEAKKMIVIKKTTKDGLKQPNTICFNKHYSEWVVHNCAQQVKKHREKAKVDSAQLRSSAQLGKLVVHNSVKSLPECAHTKDTITKDIIQKTCRVAKATLDDKKIAKELLVALINNNESFKRKYNDSSVELGKKISRWAEDVEKLRRIDKMPPEKIRDMIIWLFSSEHKDALFWRGNIQSGEKLREQFPKLINAMEREFKSGSGKKNDKNYNSTEKEILKWLKQQGKNNPEGYLYWLTQNYGDVLEKAWGKSKSSSVDFVEICKDLKK